MRAGGSPGVISGGEHRSDSPLRKVHLTAVRREASGEVSMEAEGPMKFWKAQVGYGIVGLG